MSKSDIYDSNFIKATYENLESARIILPIIFKYFTPKNIIDVGSGGGSWLKAANELGIATLTGIEGSWITKDKLLLEKIELITHDLENVLPFYGKYDMAISLEVAEHLPENRGKSFISDLCELSPVVLFSAAIPYQGGDNHINEQWQSYWYGLFKENNFVGIDLIRPQIWENINVKSWYKQNCMLYIHESKTLLFKNLEKSNFPLNIVHEEIFNIRPKYFSIKPFYPKKGINIIIKRGIILLFVILLFAVYLKLYI